MTPAQIMLAYLLALGVIPIPGARRVETAASAMNASDITLDEDELALLDERFPGLGRSPPRPPANPNGEVVVIMGMAGAGKSRLVATRYGSEHGWLRLNRDTEGGTLAQIARKLGDRLAGGARRIVLDNTYLSRATRNDVLRVAHRAGAAVRCVFLDIGLADARINVTTRMLEKHGALLGGRELQAAAKHDPNLMLPHTVARMARDLERPDADEGFASIEVIPFTREEPAGIAASAVPFDAPVAPPDGPLLVFGWRPGADEAFLDIVRARFASRLSRGAIVEVAICPHADGAPTCWCRPPLPGLWLAFARKYGVDPRKSSFAVTSPAHRAMAAELGARVV
jgi:predicted kinase